MTEVARMGLLQVLAGRLSSAVRELRSFQKVFPRKKYCEASRYMFIQEGSQGEGRNKSY